MIVHVCVRTMQLCSSKLICDPVNLVPCIVLKGAICIMEMIVNSKNRTQRECVCVCWGEGGPVQLDRLHAVNFKCTYTSNNSIHKLTLPQRA